MTTILLLLVAAAALAIGYLLALPLMRSRIEFARAHVEAEGQGRLALAQARIDQLEGTLREEGTRSQGAVSTLEATRKELAAAREEATRSGAQLEAECRRTADFEVRLNRLQVESLQKTTDLQASRQELADVRALAAEIQATLDARNEERVTLLDAATRQETDLQSLRRDLLSKTEAVATLESQIEGLHQTAAARLGALSDAQARLADTFRALSAEALQGNNEAFLQLARTQMEGGQAQAAQDLEARQQAIATLMQPVQTGLAAMQEQVQSLAVERATAEAALHSEIQHLVTAQAGLQAETGKLATALRKPEVKGKWGEVQLRNVVEFAGMTEHVDFEMQSSFDVEDGKCRPDLLVHLPGSKRIAVDAKAPLRAYLEALELEGPAKEARLDAVAG